MKRAFVTLLVSSMSWGSFPLVFRCSGSPWLSGVLFLYLFRDILETDILFTVRFASPWTGQGRGRSYNSKKNLQPLSRYWDQRNTSVSIALRLALCISRVTLWLLHRGVTSCCRAVCSASKDMLHKKLRNISETFSTSFADLIMGACAVCSGNYFLSTGR